MDEKDRAILRDYAVAGLWLAEIAEKHGLADARTAASGVQAALDELEQRIYWPEEGRDG